MRTERRARGGLWFENVRMALFTLWSQKLRSGLTLLGVIIGVATVIAMVSMIQGANRSMADQIGTLGSGVLYISKHEAGIQVGRSDRRPREDITIDDAHAIEEHCPAVAHVSPEIRAMWKVSYGRQETKSIGVIGASEPFFDANNWTIAQGRPLTREEVRHRAPVALLGASVAAELFPTGGGLGTRVRIGPESYQVIGILEEKGSFLGQDQDDLAVIPLTRMAQALGYGSSVDYIVAAPPDPGRADAAREQIEELLRRRRGVRADEENDFGITSQENLLEIYDQVTQGFYLVMVLISSIGLMVGGIGVMNMMLVSVRERTREIGLRMALGSRRRDLMAQFLVEAAVLT
ncbi:MAG: FtsX-like permease family protein, partial [Candidatus Eisenbacteria bacterium]|nr:FtsX-like permease family protein [Candidatus Latescibacterota bacterium]MBD3302169.1 FtsX-like permease family protein [Candidatus Eisenbacteria bacterium]